MDIMIVNNKGWPIQVTGTHGTGTVNSGQCMCFVTNATSCEIDGVRNGNTIVITVQAQQQSFSEPLPNSAVMKLDSNTTDRIIARGSLLVNIGDPAPGDVQPRCVDID